MLFGTQEVIPYLYPSHMPCQSARCSFSIFTCSTMETYRRCEESKSHDPQNDTTYTKV